MRVLPLTQAPFSGSHTAPLLGSWGRQDSHLGGFHCSSHQQEPPQERNTPPSSQPSAVGSWTKAAQAPVSCGGQAAVGYPLGSTEAGGRHGGGGAVAQRREKGRMWRSQAT